MKLRLLFESDLELRQLEREAEMGDPKAIELLHIKRFRSGQDSDFELKQVRTFCVSDFPEPSERWLNLPREVRQPRFYDRYLIHSLVSAQLGLRDRDLQSFNMENSSGASAGVCFIDRYNKIPDDGIDLNMDPTNRAVQRWRRYGRQTPEELDALDWNIKITPTVGWMLVIYHFNSVEDARKHYGALWSGTQERIAYKKLEAGTIGLQNQNPFDWPLNRKGLPLKSNRAALRWVSNRLPGVESVGNLQGPEFKVNWQFLFVR